MEEMSTTKVEGYIDTPKEKYLRNKGYSPDLYYVSKEGDIKKKTKHDAVKDHLRKYKTITSWEAINKYRATRLAVIIYQIKKRDLWNIVTTLKKSKDGVNYASYSLDKQFAIK